MTSGKWLSVLLRLFHGFARRAISWSCLAFRVQTGRVPSMQAVWPKEQRAAGALSAWLGWTSRGFSKSRSVALQVLQVQGSTSTSASRSVRNTLLPTPGTVQVCGSSAIAIALALHLHPGGSTPTLCYPSTSKQGLSALPALHINTPPSSLPVYYPPPIVPIVSVSLDLPRSRSFLSHPTSANTRRRQQQHHLAADRQAGRIHSSANPVISPSTQPRAVLSSGIHTHRDPSHPAGRSVD